MMIREGNMERVGMGKCKWVKTSVSIIASSGLCVLHLVSSSELGFAPTIPIPLGQSLQGQGDMLSLCPVLEFPISMALSLFLGLAWGLYMYPPQSKITDCEGETVPAFHTRKSDNPLED